MSLMFGARVQGLFGGLWVRFIGYGAVILLLIEFCCCIALEKLVLAV